jgi:4-hydroxymandelate oxidase
VNLFEIEKIASQLLSPMALDYYRSGACDEITLKANQDAFRSICLLPRMLVDVSIREQSVRLFGHEISMPVIIAPTAFHRLAHPQGELASATAAARAGTIFTLSTLSNSSIEEVADAAQGPLWFQLYVYKDRELTRSLVQRAENSGYQAIVLTADAPKLGRREADIRGHFELPDHLKVANLTDAGLASVCSDGTNSGLAAYIASLFDCAVTWKDLEWLRSLTKLPVLVKGILRADDAKLALEHGASGIIVSNHGGRQLDTAPATIDVLTDVVDAIAGKLPVLLDGGVRRGTDVMKALCLGAKAVLIGRPVLWGLAVGGEEGVLGVLNMLRDELDLALALCGCPSVQQLNRDFILQQESRYSG